MKKWNSIMNLIYFSSKFNYYQGFAIFTNPRHDTIFLHNHYTIMTSSKINNNPLAINQVPCS